MTKGRVMILPKAPKPRKNLNADDLFGAARRAFERIREHRRGRPDIPLADALCSGLAVFSLKSPSLLAFDEHRQDENMKALFHVGRVPSDTGMREILDPVAPDDLRGAFSDVFRRLQRGKALKPFEFLDGHYLVSIDGTGYFSSKSVHCDCCMTKVNKKTGEVTYHHQMLGVAIVHPDLNVVIPLAPEPIHKQDGQSKNDCERNAAKRLLPKIRADHPKLRLIVVEDGLASNAPHVRDLMANDMRFLLGAKPGDHAFLFDRFIEAFDDGRAITVSRRGGTRKASARSEASFAHGLPLNESNRDLLVNVLQYREFDADGQVVLEFSWITDLRVTRATVWEFVRGGRSRWKIENETFNTLKNQGYHFEHNFGHGHHNLTTVFATLMMLAFLIDQVQQLCCPLFRAVLAKLKTKRSLWETIRSHFDCYLIPRFVDLYVAILRELTKNKHPLPSPDTS